MAGPIGVGAFTGGAEIDFEGAQGAAIPTSTPGPFSIDAVTFSEASTGSGSAGWRNLTGCCMDGSSILTDNAGISNITLNFSSAFERIGLEVGIGAIASIYEVRFFDAGLTLLGSVSGAASGNAGLFFAGWEDAGGIARVQIIETSGENNLVGGLDNIRYESGITVVPAPGTLALLGLGLAALGFRRRG